MAASYESVLRYYRAKFEPRSECRSVRGSLFQFSFDRETRQTFWELNCIGQVFQRRKIKDSAATE